MALNPLSDDLDPLLWAQKPRSQCALNLLRAGAVEGNKALAEILAGHVRRGVCNDQGKLLMRWRDGAWVSGGAVRLDVFQQCA